MRDLRYIDALIEDNNYQTHPSNEDLAKFIDKELDKKKKEEILEHLISCDRCRDIVQSVFKDVEEVKKKSKKPINNIYKKSILSVVFLIASYLVIFVVPFVLNEEKNITIWRSISNNKKIDNHTQKQLLQKILQKVKRYDFENQNFKKAKEYEEKNDLANAKKFYKIAISDTKDITNNQIRLEITIYLFYKLVELNKKSNNTKKAKKWQEKLEFRLIDYEKILKKGG